MFLAFNSYFVATEPTHTTPDASRPCPPTPVSSTASLRLSNSSTLCALGHSGLEPIAELARDVLHRPHSARSGCLSPLCLLAPVVLPNLGRWVSA